MLWRGLVEKPGRIIGRNLKAVLDAHAEFKGNQSELARRLGVNPPDVNGFIQGRYQWPSTRTLMAYAVALNCSLDVLLDGVRGFDDQHPDLIWQGRHEESVASQHGGTPHAGADSTRVQQLEAQHATVVAELQDIVRRLTKLAGDGGEAREAPRPASGAGRGNRTTHR